MIENLVWIVGFIIMSPVLFSFGAIAMAKYINRNKKPTVIEKQPTRNSIYADHVINAAARIYCNYNESKIIRVGQGREQERKDRYSQALTESFNLVNKAYAVFDNLDNDEKQVVN